MSAWISFSDAFPEPRFPYAEPAHGWILVTNNVGAVNRWGSQSHVWLVSSVQNHEHAEVCGGKTFAEAGEITAFAQNMVIRNLTHWRPALPEEWEIGDSGFPVCRLPKGGAS